VTATVPAATPPTVTPTQPPPTVPAAQPPTVASSGDGGDVGPIRGSAGLVTEPESPTGTFSSPVNIDTGAPAEGPGSTPATTATTDSGSRTLASATAKAPATDWRPVAQERWTSFQSVFTLVLPTAAQALTTYGKGLPKVVG
jgi:hypothetical protein